MKQNGRWNKMTDDSTRSTQTGKWTKLVDNGTNNIFKDGQ